MMSESSSSSALMEATRALASTTIVLLVVRVIRRQFSPIICSKLSCRCGKIQGQVCAKREDSIRIYCYCKDCRQYAKFIAHLGNQEDTTIGKPRGDNRLVQVCKNALTIHQGRDLLKLARKAPQKESKGKICMHRYYASCCHVPLFNTVSFLGFVGVFTDFLDSNHDKFAGPVRMYPKEALGQEEPPEPDVFALDLLWKFVRYLPWKNAGPFDYDLEPVYWGKEEQNNKKED